MGQQKIIWVDAPHMRCDRKCRSEVWKKNVLKAFFFAYLFDHVDKVYLAVDHLMNGNILEFPPAL